MADTPSDQVTPEKVTAEYRCECGHLLWEENPYPFKRKFSVGQSPMAPDGGRYIVMKARFDGKFGDGKLFYVVRKVGN